MWKAILAGTAAIAIAGTSLVYAQQRDHNASARWRGHGADHAENRGPSQEDAAAFTDARIAALKAGLRLTPDQEKNWPAFEAALRDIAKAHLDHRAAAPQTEQRANDPVAELRRHAEMMSNVGASLKRLADAQEPLYQGLDDSQKKRFQLLSRRLTGHGPHFAQMRERGGGGMMRGGARSHDGEGRPGIRGPRGDRGGDRGQDSNGTGDQL
jgi:hypothetical protein